MATQVLMPKQGNSVESCIILEWKKQVGDTIAMGEILCEVETDKATIEVESTAEGTILQILYAADEDVPVQVPIAIVGEPGEDISGLSDQAGTSEETSGQAPVEVGEKTVEPAVQETQAVPSTGTMQSGVSSAASPRAKNKALKTGVDVTGLVGTGPKGRVIERDVDQASAGRQPLTPAARELFAQEQVAVPAAGSGIGGRIRLQDLKNASGSEAAMATALVNDGVAAGTAPAAVFEYPGTVTEIPVRSVRKITAKRMFESISTTCQLTLNASADARALKALRARLKSSDPALGLQNITINDLVLFATAKTLQDFPQINSHFLGDKIVEFSHVHLGCAVDSPKGLMVPVIKFADMLSLKNLSSETKRLVSACLEGKAAPEDLQGGTFTVTNLGAFGIESFTPVLNVPESAILGVCDIQLKPVEGASGVEFIPHIGLSLTFDHQSVDGAPAARFLKALAQNIKNIDLLLVK